MGIEEDSISAASIPLLAHQSDRGVKMRREENGSISLEPEFEIPEQRSPRFLFLLCIALFGLGAVGGFSTFHFLFHEEFVNTLDKIESRHNETLQVLTERLSMAMLERDQCLEDTRKDEEIGQLKGRLTARNDLAREHDSLSNDYEALVDEIEELEEAHKKTVEEGESLRAQLEDMEQQLTNQLRQSLQERAEGEQRSFAQVQKRQSSLCREEHGDGPYYVKVEAQVGDAESRSFVIEVASRKQMPHSVFTFLSLVKYQMYDGAILAGDSENDAMVTAWTFEGEVAVAQKRRVLGMDETVLMFTEDSDVFPCQENSVGFRESGPTLELYTDPSKKQASCFGTVVRGQDDFALVVEAVAAGTKVEIVQMQHLMLD